MTETEYNFFKRLKTTKINCSKIPQIVKKSSYFRELLESNVIVIEGSLRRGSVRLNEEEHAHYETFFSDKFPHPITGEFDRASNIKSLRNSKGRRTESNAVVFLRGEQQVLLNGIEINLEEYTKNFGLFSASLAHLSCEKICFVENLYSFLNAEKVIPKDYILLHTYGRVGDDLLDKIKLEKAIVFSDYDFVGLDEYLKIKEKFEQVTFFIPGNYDALFEKYSKPLQEKGRQTSQKPTQRVLTSQDEAVVRIRSQIFETQFFLEQEVVTLEGV